MNFVWVYSYYSKYRRNASSSNWLIDIVPIFAVFSRLYKTYPPGSDVTNFTSYFPRFDPDSEVYYSIDPENVTWTQTSLSWYDTSDSVDQLNYYDRYFYLAF